MEIKSSGRAETSAARRIGKPAGPVDGSFRLSDSESPRPRAVSGPGPIAAVETILTLQGLDDSLSGRSKGLAHGESLLEMLDQVRDGLLCGGIPRCTLNRLATAVGKRRDMFAEPQLQDVLDEIELRARVELAKLEQADALSGQAA